MKKFNSQEELLKFFKRRLQLKRFVRVGFPIAIVILVIVILALVRAAIIYHEHYEMAFSSVYSDQKNGGGLSAKTLTYFRFDSTQHAYMVDGKYLDRLTEADIQNQYGIIVEKAIHIFTSPAMIIINLLDAAHDSVSSFSASLWNIMIYLFIIFMCTIKILDVAHDFRTVASETYKRFFGFYPISIKDTKILSAAQPIIHEKIITLAKEFETKAKQRDESRQKIHNSTEETAIQNYQAATEAANIAYNNAWDAIQVAKVHGHITYKKIEQYY